jgi:hypothetical protein
MNHLIRYFIFISIFLLSSCNYPKEAYASSGLDRCIIPECLCEVRPGQSVSSSIHREVKSRSISLYFRENEFLLSQTQNNFLKNFLSKFDNKKIQISVIGYTDGCGSAQHNKELSQKRADEIAKNIRAVFSSAFIDKVSGGEKSSVHTASARRVDVIVHSDRKLTTAIEKIPSDYYLIDASGSMWTNHKKWSDIIAVSVKPESKVFLSITNRCRNGMYMRSVRPYGGTEIWWSYWNLIDKMKPGQSLLIVSDFESQVPLSKREAAWFREKIRNANIIVRAIRP